VVLDYHAHDAIAVSCTDWLNDCAGEHKL